MLTEEQRDFKKIALPQTSSTVKLVSIFNSIFTFFLKKSLKWTCTLLLLTEHKYKKKIPKKTRILSQT